MKKIEVGTFLDDDGLWRIALREDGDLIATYDEVFRTQDEAEQKARELVSEFDDAASGRRFLRRS